MRRERTPKPTAAAARARVSRARFALAAIALSVLACDPGAVLTPAPTAHCEEAGAQCALPSGPLGVCERSACEAGASPPCFACTPQH